MANLPSDFWAGWISVITVVSLIGLAWLVYSVYFAKRSDAGVAHQVWDETLREGTAVRFTQATNGTAAKAPASAKSAP